MTFHTCTLMKVGRTVLGILMGTQNIHHCTANNPKIGCEWFEAFRLSSVLATALPRSDTMHPPFGVDVDKENASVVSHVKGHTSSGESTS